MVITRIQGGLGNQLFQYAAGFAAARANKTTLYLDITGLERHVEGHLDRGFMLDSFNTKGQVVPPKTLFRFRYGRRLESLFPITRTHFKQLVFEEEPASKSHFFKANYLVKPFTYRFEPDVTEKRKGIVYLDGYWQSYRYFEHLMTEIENEFKPLKSFDSAVAELQQRIASSESVAVHLRRTDYITTAFGQKHFLSLPLGYYQKALAAIAAQHTNINLFVFSDDIPWCKENFDTELPLTFVANDNPLDDFYLMRACKHQIIANSSFSWWAAMLNANPHKMVVSPARWYNNVPASDMNDLLPVSWIKIDI